MNPARFLKSLPWELLEPPYQVLVGFPYIRALRALQKTVKKLRSQAVNPIIQLHLQQLFLQTLLVNVQDADFGNIAEKHKRSTPLVSIDVKDIVYALHTCWYIPYHPRTCSLVRCSQWQPENCACVQLRTSRFPDSECIKKSFRDFLQVPLPARLVTQNRLCRVE